MTLWKQGASAVSRFLAPASDHFWNPPASASAACCRSGTALVTEFAPRRIRATMIVMGVVGVALGAAWPASLPRNSCRFMALARETDPPAPPVPRADRTARPALRLPTDVANFFFANCGANDGEAAAAPRRPTTLRYHPDPHRNPRLAHQARPAGIVESRLAAGFAAGGDQLPPSPITENGAQNNGCA
jgi:hypothetical protein